MQDLRSNEPRVEVLTKRCASASSAAELAECSAELGLASL
jgi:hypothetical protein